MSHAQIMFIAVSGQCRAFIFSATVRGASIRFFKRYGHRADVIEAGEYVSVAGLTLRSV